MPLTLLAPTTTPLPFGTYSEGPPWPTACLCTPRGCRQPFGAGPKNRFWRMQWLLPPPRRVVLHAPPALEVLRVPEPVWLLMPLLSFSYSSPPVWAALFSVCTLLAAVLPAPSSLRPLCVSVIS